MLLRDIYRAYKYIEKIERNYKRFALDNTNHIIDFEDKQDKYCLEYEEVVKLLNNFNEKNKLLKETYDLLRELYTECIDDESFYEYFVTEMKQISKKYKELNKNGNIN